MAEEEKDAHTKIVLKKSPSTVWPWCWQQQNFFLSLLACPWKIPFASGMRAQALNTRAFENSNIYTLTYPTPLQLTMYNFRSNTQMSTCHELTETNLTLHSLQTDYIVIVQLFLNANLLRAHSGFTHLIMLAIPYSECSLKILPYLQISQNFQLGTLPLFNIHKYIEMQKLQGSKCNDLVKTSQSENYFAVLYIAIPQSNIKNDRKSIWPGGDFPPKSELG